jgi:SAM-dependent methyltransferase
VHDEAHAWVQRYSTKDEVEVLDLGGRDINGSVRSLFPNATRYFVVDILPGPGVDAVADASTWEPDQLYDIVVACEVFEHTAVWPGICRTAYKALEPGGWFIVTMAGPGRPPHSMHDGLFRLLPGEHYANVPGRELDRVLRECGFVNVVVDCQPSPADTRAVAVK